MTTLLAHLNRGLPSAGELAAAVRRGELSAFEVVAAARRAAMAAPSAFLSTHWDRALARASEIDRVPLDERGPLSGVPLSVKDVVAVAGLPATAGSIAFAGNVPAHTAPAVQRLIDAGAVVVGKSNCPEFAFGVTCESPLGGRTDNPRWPERTVGGSSGGEAAALAVGASALGVGTDFGGSLRWPAQCAGVAALRPTIGALSAAGQLPGAGGDLSADPAVAPHGLQGTLQTVGPMARSIDDLALGFSVMSGQESALLPVAAGRVVWSVGRELGPVRREVAELMERLAARLAAAGHEVREEATLFADCLEAYNRWREVDPLRGHAVAIAGFEDRVSERSLELIASSLDTDPSVLAARAEDAGHAHWAAITLLDSVDVAILPVAGGPACDLSGHLDVDGRDVAGWALMGHCRAVTLTGAPVVSLPVGLSVEGWPLSVQVVAAPGRDEVALSWAKSIENMCDLWRVAEPDP